MENTSSADVNVSEVQQVESTAPNDPPSDSMMGSQAGLNMLPSQVPTATVTATNDSYSQDDNSKIAAADELAGERNDLDYELGGQNDPCSRFLSEMMTQDESGFMVDLFGFGPENEQHTGLVEEGSPTKPSANGQVSTLDHEATANDHSSHSLPDASKEEALLETQDVEQLHVATVPVEPTGENVPLASEIGVSDQKSTMIPNETTGQTILSDVSGPLGDVIMTDELSITQNAVETNSAPHDQTPPDPYSNVPIEIRKRLIADQTRCKNASIARQKVRNKANDPTAPLLANNAKYLQSDADDDDEEFAKYLAAKKGIQRKRKHGQIISITDEVAFNRLQRAHKTRMNRIREYTQYEADEESLFVGEEDNDDRTASRALADSASPSPGPAVSSKQKPAKKPAKKKEAKNTKIAADRVGKPGHAKRGTGKMTKKNRTELQKMNNISNLSNLLNNDIFQDVASNKAQFHETAFTEKTRQAALGQLISSIPEELQDTAAVDKKQLDAAAKKFHKHSCKTEGTGWLITGMFSILSHYQMLGAAFMRDRENDDKEPAGGIIADQMGLGKTVMMLANIVSSYPPLSKQRKNDSKRTTLMVMPSSLISQWTTEIKKHVQMQLNVLHYKYRKVIEEDDPVKFLQGYHIILATYAQVQKEYPKFVCPATAVSVEEKELAWQKHFADNKGPLFKVHFARVVLDEAQAIKKHDTSTSRACRSLEATNRWAMSGTPVQNAIEEFYPYFRFLRVPHTGDLRVFKKNYCEDDGSTRLTQMLRSFMLRRTHADTLLGSKLLDLPEPTKITYPCFFDDIELGLYNVVRRRFMLKICSMGSDQRLKYNHALVLVLRLRQMTAHFLLINDILQDLEPEDYAEMEQIIEAYSPSKMKQENKVVLLRQMLKKPKALPIIDTEIAAQARSAGGTVSTEFTSLKSQTEIYAQAQTSTAAEQVLPTPPPESDEEDCASEPEDDDSICAVTAEITSAAPLASRLQLGNSFGLGNDYAEYMAHLKHVSASTIRTPILCTKCQQKPKQLAPMDCGHLYCWNCVQELSQSSARSRKDHIECLICKRPCSYARNHPRVEQEPEKEVRRKDGTLSTKKPKKPKKGEETLVIGRKKVTSTGPAYKRVIDEWVDGSGNMIPGAKVMAIKCQLLEWKAENPEVKVIIYTQFMPMVYILEKMCQMENWKHLTYTGAQSLDKRARTIETYLDSGSYNILLASLKCGGVGLNLTVATRVIIVDPWWNNAVEDQAFCRTFRRGQDKATAMTRFVVQGTIDDQMVAMQERKRMEIGTVMDGPASKQKLSPEELAALFGPPANANEAGEGGGGFILVDDNHLRRKGPRPKGLDADDLREP